MVVAAAVAVAAAAVAAAAVAVGHSGGVVMGLAVITL